MLVTVCNQWSQCPYFHSMDTEIAIVGVVCLVLICGLFVLVQANEGRKDESLTSGAMENTSSTVKPIDTIFFEKPIINVVASYCMYIWTVY